MNKKWLYSIGVSLPLITALVLSGIVVKPELNLFNTGITIGHILVVGNLFLGWAIYKNHI